MIYISIFSENGKKFCFDRLRRIFLAEKDCFNDICENDDVDVPEILKVSVDYSRRLIVRVCDKEFSTIIAWIIDWIFDVEELIEGNRIEKILRSIWETCDVDIDINTRRIFKSFILLEFSRRAWICFGFLSFCLKRYWSLKNLVRSFQHWTNHR